MSFRWLAPLLLLLLLGPLAAPGALSVYLHRVAYLEADTYSLGDIASVPAAEQGSSQLLRTPLGRSPDRPTLLAAGSIREALAAAGHTQVVLVGGRVALLPRHAIPAAVGRFYEDLLAFLDRTDGMATGRLELEILRAGTVPAASGYDFALAGSPAPRATATQVPLLSGELLLRYGPAVPPAGAPSGPPPSSGGTVRLWVHRYLPVAHAAAAVPARSRLDGGQVVYREVDVSLSAQPFLTPDDGVESLRSAVALPAGARIEPRHVERVLAVRTGEAVQVVFLRPGLRGGVPGRALGSGAVGERIEVRLGAGGKRFEGQIAAGGEVCVEGF